MSDIRPGAPHQLVRLVNITDELPSLMTAGKSFTVINNVGDELVVIDPATYLRNPLFYAQMRKILDVVSEYVTVVPKYAKGKPYVELGQVDVNPYYNQTVSGMYMWIESGIARDLWTPWGLMSLCTPYDSGDLAWQGVTAELIRRFGAVPSDAISAGVYPRDPSAPKGLLYGLHAIDGEALPYPIALPYEGFASYVNCEMVFDDLTNKYVGLHLTANQ